MCTSAALPARSGLVLIICTSAAQPLCTRVHYYSVLPRPASQIRAPPFPAHTTLNPQPSTLNPTRVHYYCILPRSRITDSRAALPGTHHDNSHHGACPCPTAPHILPAARRFTATCCYPMTHSLHSLPSPLHSCLPAAAHSPQSPCVELQRHTYLVSEAHVRYTYRAARRYLSPLQ